MNRPLLRTIERLPSPVETVTDKGTVFRVGGVEHQELDMAIRAADRIDGTVQRVVKREFSTVVYRTRRP